MNIKLLISAQEMTLPHLANTFYISIVRFSCNDVRGITFLIGRNVIFHVTRHVNPLTLRQLNMPIANILRKLAKVGTSRLINRESGTEKKINSFVLSNGRIAQ